MTIDNTEAAEAVAPRAPVRPDAPTFADLGARPETVAALEAVGIIHAFAIQEYAVPIALRGTDLIGQAPTGTGKTLGFGVPLLDRVTAPTEGADGLPQALVVVPTRELGLQVARDIAAAGKTRGIRVLPLYGGVAYEPQVDALQKGVEIVVGTPGRLLDLAKSKHLRLHAVRALVLDEADRMLDLGFLDDVERILTLLPEDRQTMLFSATMPDPIVTLARRFLRHPMTIHAHHDASTGPSPLTKQFIYRTHPMNKIEIVARILQAEDRGLTMIFTRTKRAADRVAEDLDFRGFAAAAVHGDLGQGARERALRAFRAGKIDVLVATDVAARGLDVSGVTHVINYDCPEDQDTYTHRIGRTGRAGATGVAVTFVDWEDMPRWRIIDKTLGMDLAEPPETYHTSSHLLTDIGIPEGITGSLPTADRKRAGLAAEQLEDIEGKPRGRGRTRGRARGGDSSGPAPAADPTGEPRRPRRRRRRGEVDPTELTLTDSAEAAGTSADAGEQSEPRPARTRTRRRQVVGQVAEGSDTADTGPVATAEATEDGEPRTARARTRRRRRGGRGKGGEGSATEGSDSVEA
ncbi:DEAD/DEAH box helicase [Dactylosporangium sp. NPDC049742]|uniref:DEAD/DEAH box helicase n=1 Tax=Dactylosporangium sp. NPDC049742 TaxID=3154737 RepID=UPI00342A987A